MAHSRSNLNLTNPIKELVSKRRNRYRQDGFNLDLTYITTKIIAMGFPASNIEGVYRNHIDDVVNMLEKNHLDRYFIYNLCSERSYHPQKFHNRVKKYPFDDHNPPRLDLIRPFCEDVQGWLDKHEENVAVVHCKAGKGRTGTMICCYLLHSGGMKNADDALRLYGETRTQDQKGVTIPSQVRYVRYYGRIVRDGLVYRPAALYLTEIRLEPPPTFGNRQVELHFSVYNTREGGESGEPAPAPMKVYKSTAVELTRTEQNYTVRFRTNIALRGDVKIELHSKSMISKKSKLFQFWFNTFFVDEEVPSGGAGPSQPPPQDANGYLNNSASNNQPQPTAAVTGGNRPLTMCLRKGELDIVSKKDKQNKMFSADFKITLFFLKKSSNEGTDWMLTPNLQQAQERSSGSSEDSDTDSSEWDSGESTVL
ncbi:phosphatidylinositol 3,4,5-trisphosphate 3-phosphatase and dual-specificity protein phosphatase PTEN isoform X2 [Atheta coriaria]|uniref:phosphatidylinositol 3,4,5-trisphosphate 3-phosphatase and dual-specificity protein phosphatase PTEN isoform X2 n=1 Tax=Dalotia coriaria TaxID=877792 RepID=UPI0031F37FCA